MLQLVTDQVNHRFVAGGIGAAPAAAATVEPCTPSSGPPSMGFHFALNTMEHALPKIIDEVLERTFF